jgi:hypothetical protein
MKIMKLGIKLEVGINDPALAWNADSGLRIFFRFRAKVYMRD